MRIFLYSDIAENDSQRSIFIEFVALIIRSRFYTLLKDENEKLESRQNYMTVPAAIRELEKIEMIRGMDRIYRLDHAITATKKTILGAFGINVPYIKDRVNRISEQLRIAVLEELMAKKRAM